MGYCGKYLLRHLYVSPTLSQTNTVVGSGKGGLTFASFATMFNLTYESGDKAHGKHEGEGVEAVVVAVDLQGGECAE